MPEFTPQIVMNSFICPDKEVVVAFTWSRSVADDIDDIENTTAISGSATLFENEIELATEQLFSGEGSAYVKFYHTPAEGCHYRVVANIDSYGEVSAETYIPKSCTVSVEITKQLLLPGYDYDNNTQAAIHIGVNNIETMDATRSLWFDIKGRGLKLYQNFDNPDGEWQEVTIDRWPYINFCDNLYVDNFNRAEEVDLTGESIYLDYRTGDPMYYGYIRLPYANIKKCSSFEIAGEFIYEHVSGYEESYKVDERLTHVRLSVISPSDELDRYSKSAYQQSEGIYYFDVTPISFDEVRVFTNVKNGLGIFAGYSQTTVDAPIKNFSEEE